MSGRLLSWLGRAPAATGARTAAAAPASAWRRWRSRLLRALVIVAGLWLATKVVVALVPKPPLAQLFSTSSAVYDARGRLLRLTLAADEKYRVWTPLPRISPTLVEATLLYEDRHFHRHFAVNPVALARAAWSTYASSGPRLGGSTITMQLARRLYRIPSRTVGGKLRQIARAMQLELLYSKEQILEAYLNLTPFGRNIEGIGAASLIYFGKPPDQLQLPEALALAVIPQSPARRALGAGTSGPGLETVRAGLFRRWTERHPTDRSQASLLRLPLDLRGVRDLPFAAPHFVQRVLAPRAPRPELATTLDLSLQRLVERHARAYLARHSRLGLCNVAALLVDHRTMEVKAALGSADFFAAAIAGQVDGTQAKRSPGSTLKPLIYALALEQGIIHPLTMIKDTPLSLPGFAPENFDGRFVGPLSATDALIRSRNIPALTIATKLGAPSFHDFLRSAGVTQLRSAEHYGLALVLGGGEVTMEELVRLYSMLARGGELRPLRRLRDDPAAPGPRLLSAAASFVVLQMLAESPRPDRSPHAAAIGDERPVAWKTGTSPGLRDAWTVGVFGPYVLAVWLGNFSGEPNPALVGVKVAAPLFFEIVDSLRAGQRLDERPARPPSDVSSVEVCALSGGLPNAHCPHRRATWFIPGRSPIEVCAIHRQVLVDRAGRRACGAPDGATRAEVFEFWPSDLLELFRQAGIPRRLPPAPGRGCSVDDQASRGVAPRITSPVVGVTYTVRERTAATDRLPLRATVDADAREVYWFVNESYVGRARSGAPLLWRPRPGVFVVRAVDDHGRADARDLRVEPAPR